MSSCLSGGGRAYGFDLDLVKSTSPASRSTHSSSSSPSSTLSESSNSAPLAISTKKSRTPRKRPNQTSTEAAALLAKIYPNIFSTKNLRKHCKLTKPCDPFLDTSELLPPFPGLADAGFLLRSPVMVPEKPNSFQFERKTHLNSPPKSRWIAPEIDFREGLGSIGDDDFDAESILDEDMGEGIDSIMGNLSGESEDPPDYSELINPYLGHFGGRFQLNITRALKQVGNCDWWCSPTVEMQNIVPKMKPLASSPPEKKKKKKKVEKLVSLDKLGKADVKQEESKAKYKPNNNKVKGESEDSSSSSSTMGCLKPALSLRLNYDCVMEEWSGKGSPFSEVENSSESPADIIAKLSDIDLLSEVAASGGMREASVLRYKEKRRSRLFSKKIRYQVRKVSADRRPRMKASSGRFVRRDDE